MSPGPLVGDQKEGTGALSTLPGMRDYQGCVIKHEKPSREAGSTKREKKFLETVRQEISKIGTPFPVLPAFYNQTNGLLGTPISAVLKEKYSKADVGDRIRNWLQLEKPNQSLSNYERGYRVLFADVLKKLADFFRGVGGFFARPEFFAYDKIRPRNLKKFLVSTSRIWKASAGWLRSSSVTRKKR